MIPATFTLLAGIFLIGTYTVATLDDLIRMRASRSFLYIWAALAAGLFYAQDAFGEEALWPRLALAALMAVVCKSGVAGMRLAWGDIIAMMPALMLLPLLNAALFLALVFVADRLVLRLFYAKLLRRQAYPFMPAILAGMVLSIMLYGQLTGVSLGDIPGLLGAPAPAEEAAANASGGLA